MFLILSSALFGLSLAKIFSAFIVNKIGYVFFSPDNLINIPNLTSDMVNRKSHDLIEYGLFVFISLAVFLVLNSFYKKRRYDSRRQVLIGVSFLSFSACTLLTTFFSGYSGTNTVMFVLVYSLFLAYVSTVFGEIKMDVGLKRLSVYNGVLVAFYLSVLLQNMVASIIIPLTLITTLPIVFYLLVNKYRELGSPGLIFLSLFFLFPYDKNLLLILGIMSVVLVVYFDKLLSKRFVDQVKKVYPLVLLFIFLFDPVFYVGSFDSIEEGIWAGWLYRLVDGQVPYRDFAIYHPPVLLWGLKLFTFVLGESLYSIRLYFHLLQIIGLVIMYVFLEKLIKKEWIRLLIFMLMISYGSSVVRNNLEIRLASGLLPILFIDIFQLSHKRKYLLVAGILAGVSLFVSTEVGVASAVSVLIASALIKTGGRFHRNILIVILGMLIASVFMILVLISSGSLSEFIENIAYYTAIFSSGYMNSPMPQPKSAALIDWFNVDSYIGSVGFIWNMFEVGVMVVILSLVSQFKMRGVVRNKHFALLAGLSIYGLILGRSALGRSDFYHVSFVVVLSLILIGYLLDRVVNLSRETVIFVLCLLILLIGRGSVSSLIKDKFFMIQAYANPAGSYPEYKTDKIGLLADPGTNVDEFDQLIEFIELNTVNGDTIFVFPWSPEIYFLTNRANATSFDTPLSYITSQYQNQMVDELKENNPAIIVYKPDFAVGGLSREVLGDVDDYIINNYYPLAEFGKFSILSPHPKQE